MLLESHRRLYFVLLSALFTVSSQQQTLFDILQPNSKTRIYDTLSAAVFEEYANQPIQFDPSKVIAFEPKPISIPTTNKKYKTILYDGDMVISTERLQRIADHITDDIDGGKRSKRKAYLDQYYPSTIWSDGVPYELHGSLSLRARLSIQRAIRFWQDETCVTFRKRNRETFFLQFVGYEDGCWSTVGRDDTVPQQVVSIGNGCEHFGVTSHELAHALGVFHEQSRYDRDAHVQLNTRTVDNGLLFNFAKISPKEMTTYNLPYDVGSVMHYAPTEFSNSKYIPALTTVDPNLQQSMGSMDKPSFLDVLAINRHYHCENKCKNSLSCANGGYQNPNNCNQCKCPDGTGGRTCETVQRSFSRHCGGEIRVEETVRRFDISIQQTGRALKEKLCVYHLKAPPGKRVLINLLRLSGKCIEGCYVDGVEFKMGRDFRPVGYRFCCAQSQLRRLVSQTNTVPIMAYSKNGPLQLTFEYTTIDAHAAHDEATLSDNDLIRVNNTIYSTQLEHKSTRLGIDIAVLKPENTNQLNV